MGSWGFGESGIKGFRDLGILRDLQGFEGILIDFKLIMGFQGIARDFKGCKEI